MLKFLLTLSILCAPADLFSQNRRIDDFDTAKRYLDRLFPSGETIYSGCRYSGKTVNLKSCGYRPKNPRSARSSAVEWEHIVPAENLYGPMMGKSKASDHAVCDSRKRKISRRECARLISEDFQRAEADLYNLQAEIGELNGLRSNYPMAELDHVSYGRFGDVRVKLGKKAFEPRPEVKGDVARVYLYMDSAYPNLGILSDSDERQMMERWSRADPVSKEEALRARMIMAVQGNCNPFVLNCN